MALKERFLTDERGGRVGVALDIEDHKKVLEDLEELESIRAYDAAKTSGETSVPFDEAMAESSSAVPATESAPATTA